MKRLSLRFRSQQFFSRKICSEFFAHIYRDLYGDVMLVSMWMGTNMAARNQQEHRSLRFATK